MHKDIFVDVPKPIKIAYPRTWDAPKAKLKGCQVGFTNNQGKDLPGPVWFGLYEYGPQ